MNKYLMMSAAAVLASANGATASNAGNGISLGGGCGLNIVGSGKGVYAVLYTSCGGPGVDTGQGLSRKTAQGKSVELSSNYFGSAKSLGISYDISLPLRSGGTWATWIEISGVTAFLANSGTYTAGAAHKKGRNVAAETKALIARLRAAKGQHR